MSAFEAPHNSEVEQIQQQPHVPNVIKNASSDEESIELEYQKKEAEKVQMILQRDHKKYSVSEFMTHAASKNQIINLLVDHGK